MKKRTINPRLTLVGGFTIKPYEKGVVIRLDRLIKEIGPGLHFNIPFVDKIEVFDMRPQHHSTDYTLLSKDKYVLAASANVRYRVANPTSVITSAIEDFERYSDILMEYQGRTEICKDMVMDLALENRDKVSASIEKFLREQTAGWGISIETVVLNDLVAPQVVPETREKVFEAGAKADVYRLETQARVDMAVKYYNEISSIFKILMEGHPAKDLPYIAYGIKLFLSDGTAKLDGIDPNDPIIKSINREIEARGIGKAAKAIAEEIESSPELVYERETIKEAILGCKGLLALDLSSGGGLKALNERLKKRLYNQ